MTRAADNREPRPSELLYDAVGTGMAAFAYAAFRVHVLGGAFPLKNRVVLIATHRRLTDPPLLLGALYVRNRVWRRREPRPWFAVRDDLFTRGALALPARRLPPPLRRALFRVDPDRLLRRVRCLPATSGRTLRASQALAALAGDAALDDVLPGPLVERARRRADARGLPDPETAGDLLRAEYVDLLWEPLERSDDCWPAARSVWERRAVEAVGALRQIVALVAAGEPFVLFPEGRISRDGSIGPVRRGVRAVVRKGKPDALLPIGIAYDPLTSGRTRAYVAVGNTMPPPTERIEETILAVLRRTMPLTRGQVVSRVLLEAARGARPTLRVEELRSFLAEEAEGAVRAGRRAAPNLLHLDDCVAALEHRRLVRRRGPSLMLDAAACEGDPTLAWLSHEYESAREPPP